MTDIKKHDWEAICRRCGQCCFNKIIEDDGTVYATPIPCRYFDIINRTCKVYDKRFETGEECIKLTPELVRHAIWLPEDCAYVERFRKAKKPEENE